MNLHSSNILESTSAAKGKMSGWIATSADHDGQADHGLQCLLTPLKQD